MKGLSGLLLLFSTVKADLLIFYEGFGALRFFISGLKGDLKIVGLCISGRVLEVRRTCSPEWHQLT